MMLVVLCGKIQFSLSYRLSRSLVCVYYERMPCGHRRELRNVCFLGKHERETMAISTQSPHPSLKRVSKLSRKRWMEPGRMQHACVDSFGGGDIICHASDGLVCLWRERDGKDTSNNIITNEEERRKPLIVEQFNLDFQHDWRENFSSAHTTGQKPKPLLINTRVSLGWGERENYWILIISTFRQSEESSGRAQRPTLSFTRKSNEKQIKGNFMRF